LWNRGVFAGEYGKGYRGQCQSQSEQYTKINEPAFAEPSSTRSRGTTASREGMADVCGTSGAFLFHDWNLGLCERILEESRRCGLAWRGVDALDSGDLKMPGKSF
jgi:hypothetical protein